MIDYNFLKSLEGFATEGTVPNPNGSQSGVTVGMGVDLGQTNLARLSLPNELYNKLKPYEGLKKPKAVEFLNANPLILTEEEATLLSQKALLRHLTFVKNMWNSPSQVRWGSVPDSIQTVVFSVLYQYGSPTRVPKFWEQALSLSVSGMIKELRDFGDAYPTRRNKEADYLIFSQILGEDNEKYI